MLQKPGNSGHDLEAMDTATADAKYAVAAQQPQPSSPSMPPSIPNEGQHEQFALAKDEGDRQSAVAVEGTETPLVVDSPAVPETAPEQIALVVQQSVPRGDQTTLVVPVSRAGPRPKHGNRGSEHKKGAPNSPYSVGKPWSSGLYDFDENKNNAMMTTMFPCVTFGQIAEILDEGKTSCTLGSIMFLLPPILTCAIIGTIYRKRLRRKYNLVQAPAEDWILHLCCPCCALCQEYRELQSRGIDPSLGWLGNLAIQQEMMPPAAQSMDV